MSRLKLVFQNNDQVEIHYETKQFRVPTTYLLPFLKQSVKNPYVIEFSFTNKKDIPSLLNLIGALPPQCIGLDFANSVGDNLFKELPLFFAALPAHMTHIMLDNVFKDKLLPFLKVIAQNQQESMLPQVKAKLREIFSALPSGISHLSLRRNAFTDHLDSLYTILDAIKHVQSIDLRDNDWYQLDKESWPKVMSKLSERHSEMAIDFNYPGGTLSDDMASKLQIMLTPFPNQLKSITLNMRDFTDLPIHSNILKHIPNRITTLRWIVPSAEEDIQNPMVNVPLADIFKATPVWIDTVFFSDYPLDSLNKELFSKFVEALRALPPHVKTLNLERNRLSHLSIQDLSQLLAATPSHVESVVLRNNRLFQHKTPQEIDQLLTSLRDYNPEGRLDLEDNGEDAIWRIAAPLKTMIRSETISTDVANQISEKINPRYARFFTAKDNDEKMDEEKIIKDHKYQG